ncbi:MAG: ADP-ribosylation factor-like protein [Candidatus Hodarchaeota archaeon]
MDHFLEKDWEKDLRGLFKRDIDVDNESLADILDLPVDSLQGIDTVSKDKLASSGINSIYDLSQVDFAIVDIGMDKSIIKKWVRKAKIIINYVQNPLTRKKLLLVGLDYAGKTSLLSVLKKDYSSIQDLLPTKGAQRDGVEFFGIPIITWDLGGQALYRKDYLDDKKYKLYFSETDVVFYVMDVQDQARYDESLGYYGDMLEAYNKLNEKPTVIILFHKLDPSLLEKEKFMRSIAELQVKIADVSTEHEFSPIFANTSIYDKNSVFSAFSLGIRNISETASLVTQLMEDYCIKTNGSAAVLLSSEGEVFAQTGVTKEYIELVTQNGLLLDTMLAFNVTKGFNPEKQPVIKFTDNEKYLIGLHVSSKMNVSIFVWLLVKNLIDFTSSVQFFKNEVEPLLNLFII